VLDNFNQSLLIVSGEESIHYANDKFATVFHHAILKSKNLISVSNLLDSPSLNVEGLDSIFTKIKETWTRWGSGFRRLVTKGGENEQNENGFRAGFDFLLKKNNYISSKIIDVKLFRAHSMRPTVANKDPRSSSYEIVNKKSRISFHSHSDRRPATDYSIR